MVTATAPALPARMRSSRVAAVAPTSPSLTMVPETPALARPSSSSSMYDAATAHGQAAAQAGRGVDRDLRVVGLPPSGRRRPAPRCPAARRSCAAEGAGSRRRRASPGPVPQAGRAGWRPAASGPVDDGEGRRAARRRLSGRRTITARRVRRSRSRPPGRPRGAFRGCGRARPGSGRRDCPRAAAVIDGDRAARPPRCVRSGGVVERHEGDRLFEPGTSCTSTRKTPLRVGGHDRVLARPGDGDPRVGRGDATERVSVAVVRGDPSRPGR